MTHVLLVDRSGRGHAFADLFVRTNDEVRVHYVPGCAAISHPRIQSAPELSLDDADALVAYAREASIDIAFVANATALASGMVDALREAGVPVVGPDRQASRLEASKVYGKAMCTTYGLPVAPHACFDDAEAARAYVRSLPYDVVVKADGLCGGNGSIVCDDKDQAYAAIDRLMVDRAFGEAGARVVIEQRLAGRELSVFALTDGRAFLLLPIAADYPKSDDGNTGMTCGGVGAFSPHPLDDEALQDLAASTLLEPLMACFEGEGIRYTGVVYVGCMLTEGALRVLEINVRMGDPEAEVVLPRVTSDFLGLTQAMLDQTLERHALQLDPRAYCDIVATQGRTRQRSRGGASKGWYKGWPYGRYGKHYPISGLDRVDPDTCRVFLGGALDHPEKGLVSDGGRVLHVVGVADTVEAAAHHALENIRHVHFEGMRYRTDIGRVMPWDAPSEAPALVSK